MKVLKLEAMTARDEAKGGESMVKKADDMVKVLGVGVSSTSMNGVLTKIDEWVGQNLPAGRQVRLIVTINPEFVMMAQDDPEFKKILNGADLAIADGVGLKLAGVKQVVPGRKVVEAIVRKHRTFCLGSRVASEMAKKFGGGYDDGEIDIKKPLRNDEIVAKINKFMPDVLLVAYGAPWQEKWLFANRYKLNAKVGMGVGGAFDYLTGHTPTPPELISKMGLEWLWRLVHEPWRWRRQLALLKYLYKLAVADANDGVRS